MKNFNLSRWAIEHKSLVFYFMLAIAVAALGGTERSGDARDDFEIDVGFAEGLDFFCGAAEEERVAPFEADYDFVFGGVGEEERVDVLLG